MTTISGTLGDRLNQKGLRFRLVPSAHVQDLQARILAEYTQGLFSAEFFHERLQFYRFTLPEGLPATRSIIVVALPRPQTPVNFTYRGKSLTLILPPTYAQFNQINDQVKHLITTIIAPEGFQVADAILPLKLLAACSGLAEYGRNNVCYIRGFGSFFQLAAYYSDLPCQADPWQEPHMLERCTNCQACLIKCPTGAIAADRFLLHAERCLTFHNERTSARPFPAEIDPTIHNAVVGCMLCQRFCPEDKPFLDFFEPSVDFSAEETASIMRGVPLEDLSPETIGKLDYLELTSDLDKLPRNLGVFFKGR
jgi:epoxyqueuosine reductase